MDVSIIIVNYNTCELTRNCLKSIFEQTKGIDFEVIVSDNDSKDDSKEMIKKEFPQVILIENNANLGFGAANNRGLKIAKGKYILYLNSDTILLNNAVKLFFDYWENSTEKDTIGALGGNLLDKDGSVTFSYGNFPKPIREIIRFWKKIFITYIKIILSICKIDYRKYKKKAVYIIKNGNVGFVSGANLFVKNNELALFDERFFLYFEETNLEYQMMKKDLYRKVITGPKIVHLCGGSDTIKKNDYISFSSIQYDLSRIRFIKYNYHPFYAFILKIMLFLFWLTPGIYTKTKNYRKNIWGI